MSGATWVLLSTLILTASACGGRRGGGGDDDVGDGDADADGDGDGDGDGDADSDGDGDADCVDVDDDGDCRQDDCDDLDPTVGPCGECPADDGDCDGTPDVIDCYDDFEHVYTCVDVGCNPADNYCPDAWYIVYCVDGVQYGANCVVACTTDEATWSQACSAPALAGECSGAEGACLCWCEESYDSCVNEYTIRFTRDGVTYDVDCRDYCGGSCDADRRACACP